MLASKFSGRWDESMERDKEGNFFIDQEFPIFEVMVNYLRAKACQTPNAPPLTSPGVSSNFLRMVEYYGMTLGIHPAKIELCTANPSKVEFGDDLSVNASEWATFAIATLGHKLIIKSFEVIINQVERAQIGWRHKSIAIGDICGTDGVGEVQDTVALDCCRSVMLVNGVLLPIDGTCKEGSTIRCEEGGKNWYIDGRLVASTDQSDQDVALINTNATGLYAIPAISAKGSFTVSDVEYHLHHT
jgi:hypothetical protein